MIFEVMTDKHTHTHSPPIPLIDSAHPVGWAELKLWERGTPPISPSDFSARIGKYLDLITTYNTTHLIIVAANHKKQPVRQGASHCLVRDILRLQDWDDLALPSGK